jgi:hypothetical protein
MPFVKGNFSSLAIDVAADIQDRISGMYLGKTGNAADIISLGEALPIDQDFISKSLTPSRHTLLHKFIENYVSAEYQYGARKYEEEYPPMIYTLLNEYNVQHNEIPYTGRDSNYSLYEIAMPAIGSLAHHAFCILFENRELMRDFSRLVASLSNGLYPRASYWPTWLEEALFNRERGRCAMCFCDLTGVIAVNKKIHIDHMVPISAYGTNDPTNLQVLCDSCNLEKGNRNDNTSAVRHVPWTL